MFGPSVCKPSLESDITFFCSHVSLCYDCGSGGGGSSEVPVDVEMFLGRLMAAGLGDSVTPPTAAPGGREASYARLEAYGLLRAPPPRFA